MGVRRRGENYSYVHLNLTFYGSVKSKKSLSILSMMHSDTLHFSLAYYPTSLPERVPHYVLRKLVCKYQMEFANLRVLSAEGDSV